MEKPIIAKSTKKIAPSKKSHVFCGFFHHFHYATVCFVHELPNPKNPAKMLQAQEVRSPGKKLMAFGSFAKKTGRKKTKKTLKPSTLCIPNFWGEHQSTFPHSLSHFSGDNFNEGIQNPLRSESALRPALRRGAMLPQNVASRPTVLEPKKRGKAQCRGSIDELTHANIIQPS